MSKKTTNDKAYYDKTCFGDDFIEAKKNGTLMSPRKGETTLDAIKRYAEARKKAAVSMRLPLYVVKEAKAQAKKAGVTYTAYISTMLEMAVMANLQPLGAKGSARFVRK
ncbi:MAG: hypothetical protein LBU89_08355 [Fibromonadaceae bacterium]|jgi:predicted DNA binding CopG/RHH family protein|nr:hypothetical protein [Fibromonadaceae bacterium]